jgi:hypothetical protein
MQLGAIVFIIPWKALCMFRVLFTPTIRSVLKLYIPPHGTCPTYHNTLHLITLTISGKKHTSKLLTQFSPAAYYFLLIRQKVLQVFNVFEIKTSHAP